MGISYLPALHCIAQPKCNKGNWDWEANERAKEIVEEQDDEDNEEDDDEGDAKAMKFIMNTTDFKIRRKGTARMKQKLLEK